MTDAELAVALSSKEDAVIAALYERYAQRGINYAFGMLGSRGDAEDIVHEAFCRLMSPQQRHRLSEGDDQLTAVFFTAVRNLAIDAMRRKKTRRQQGLVGEPVSQPSETQQADADELRNLVDQLPLDWSSALKLRVDAQLTYAQIAEVLGCSLGQVRNRIYRARKQLAEDLTRRGILING